MPSQSAFACRFVRGFRACCLLLPLLIGVAAPAAENGVDLALVLVTDVSYSVDDNEARFQREGAVSAFRSEEVVKAIEAGALGRIAVAYLDFSSYNTPKLVTGWHIIHDKASADAFADILSHARLNRGVETSISSGLELAERLLDAIGLAATQRAIDVSGDGPNNDGKLVEPVRDEIIARGITINGLPIMTEADKFDTYYLPDLDKYYEGCVIGGPHSFIHVAHGFEDIARAMRRKLVLEISDATHSHDVQAIVPVALPPRRSHPVYDKGCDIGERMRYGGVSFPR